MSEYPLPHLNHHIPANIGTTSTMDIFNSALKNPVPPGQQTKKFQNQDYGHIVTSLHSAEESPNSSSQSRKKNSRRRHRNSHLGCGTCKKRRIKCDETLPSCMNCLKGKLHCAYLNLDEHARNALRMAQYNQNLRHDRHGNSQPHTPSSTSDQESKVVYTSSNNNSNPGQYPSLSFPLMHQVQQPPPPPPILGASYSPSNNASAASMASQMIHQGPSSQMAPQYHLVPLPMSNGGFALPPIAEIVNSSINVPTTSNNTATTAPNSTVTTPPSTTQTMASNYSIGPSNQNRSPLPVLSIPPLRASAEASENKLPSISRLTESQQDPNQLHSIPNYNSGKISNLINDEERQWEDKSAGSELRQVIQQQG